MKDNAAFRIKLVRIQDDGVGIGELAHSRISYQHGPHIQGALTGTADKQVYRGHAAHGYTNTSADGQRGQRGLDILRKQQCHGGHGKRGQNAHGGQFSRQFFAGVRFIGKP